MISRQRARPQRQPEATRAKRGEARRTRGKRTGRAREWRDGAARSADRSEIHGAVFGCFLLLAGLGTVMVFSTTAPLSVGESIPPHFLRHVGAVLAGGVLALAVSRLPLRVWHALALPLWALVLALLAITLRAGVKHVPAIFRIPYEAGSSYGVFFSSNGLL